METRPGTLYLAIEDGNKVECTIHTTTFDDMTEYEALSYAWGDLDTMKWKIAQSSTVLQSQDAVPQSYGPPH
jgi:hypothetical protein